MWKKRQQTMQRDGTDYRTLNMEIRNKCRQVTEGGVNETCTEIERISIRDKADMNKRIK